MEPDPETALDELLDAMSGGDAAGAERILAAHPDLAPLAGAARAVADTAGVAPSPAVAARHVRALMDEATRLSTPQVVATPRRRRLRRSLASVGALVALLLVGAPITAALAANAQPGQALYGTKLFVERVQLAVQRDPARKLSLRLAFARERLQEIQRLVDEDKTSRVASVLANLASEQAQVETTLTKLAAEGRAPPALVQKLNALVAQHQDRLQSLGARCQAGTLAASQCAALNGAATKTEDVARILRRLQRTEGGISGGSGRPAPGGRP